MWSKEDLKAIIRNAERLIRSGHTKNNLAINVKGEPCPPESEEACAWCEWGAIQAAAYYYFEEHPDNRSQALMRLNDVLYAANPGRQYEEYKNTKSLDGAYHVTYSNNDSPATTQEDIINRFHNAAEFLDSHEAEAIIEVDKFQHLKVSGHVIVHEDW